MAERTRQKRDGHLVQPELDLVQPIEQGQGRRRCTGAKDHVSPAPVAEVSSSCRAARQVELIQCGPPWPCPPAVPRHAPDRPAWSSIARRLQVYWPTDGSHYPSCRPSSRAPRDVRVESPLARDQPPGGRRSPRSERRRLLLVDGIPEGVLGARCIGVGPRMVAPLRGCGCASTATGARGGHDDSRLGRAQSGKSVAPRRIRRRDRFGGSGGPSGGAPAAIAPACVPRWDAGRGFGGDGESPAP